MGSNGPKVIQQAITETLDSIIKSVTDILDPDQRVAYIQTAGELRKELEQSDPNTTVIQKFMKVLSFGDALDGTLELGEKAFIASTIVAPYMPILYEYIGNYLVRLGAEKEFTGKEAEIGFLPQSSDG